MNPTSTDDYLRLSGEQRRALLDTVLATYGWKCCICELRIEPGQESLQHVKPRSKGGLTTLENSKPAHKRCNSALGNRELKTDGELEPSQAGAKLVENGEWFFLPGGGGSIPRQLGEIPPEPSQKNSDEPEPNDPLGVVL